MELLVSIENKIGRIVLNRPESLNAIKCTMWSEIPDIMQSLQSQGARVIIFSGKGDSFASGADLDELKELSTYVQAKKLWNSIADCLNFVASFPLPTIAQINGACIGGGCLLALACDLRYASDNATFSIPVAHLSIVLDDENIFRLLKTAGLSRTYEMIYLGNVFSAKQAEHMSLINQTVSIGELKKLVESVGQRIVNNSAQTIEQAKCSIQRLLAVNNQKQDQKLIVNSYLSQEFSQRLKQIIEK